MSEINPKDIDVHTLLPQQEPFVMIGRLKACDENGVTTETEIKDSNIFVANGKFRTAGMVENIAQSCAARMGYISKYIKHSDITIGVIGAVRKFSVIEHPKAGDTITTSIEIIDEVMGVTLAMATISAGDHLLAKGQIKLAESDKKDETAGNSQEEGEGHTATAIKVNDHTTVYDASSIKKEETADGYNVSVALDPECFIYKAHFPGHPITPGVCIVQMVSDLLGAVLGKQLEVSALKDAKFLSILSPENDSDVDVTFNNISVADDGSITAQAIVSYDDTTFATIKLTCIERK